MMIIWVFALVVVVAIGLILLKRIAAKTEDKTDTAKFKYEKNKTLFTAAERSFLGVLNQAVDDNTVILGKVRVADVIRPEKGLNKSDYQKAFNKISKKHFDFLACDKKEMSVVCAIELNDKSHQQENRKERDDFLTEACRSANLQLIQFDVKSAYNLQEIKEKILEKK